MSSPLLIIASLISLFNLIKHLMFIVKSSSFDNVEVVSFKLGLMQTGGTGRSWTIKELMWVDPATFISSHYLSGICWRICRASQGFNS